MISRIEVMKHACPACGTAPDAACIGANGKKRWSLHVDRWTAARAALAPAPTKEPTDAEILDFLEKRACVEARDGGWSSFYFVSIPKMAMGPWQKTHGGEYDHKTLREAVAAQLKAKP